MSREIQADYATQYLFPRSLEEWVGPEDPARFIREFVRALDLDALRSAEEAAAVRDSVGRPHYSLELLLSVWLYAYVYGLRSSREVERGCRKLFPLLWLAGTHQPDHNTLWRFWNQHRSKLHEIFVQSVKIAIKSGAVGMVLQAVDGTKIASRGSKRSEWHRSDLEKLLPAAEARLVKIENEIEASGSGEAAVDDRLPEALQQQKKLVETVRSQCSRTPKGRLIEVSPHHAAIARNQKALQDPKIRKLMRERSAIVERIFAEIKETLGLRQWSVAGKAKVAAQWAVMCTAMNLRRMIAARSGFA